jgi:hypothetical protein
VHGAEIGHFGDAPELGRRDGVERAEHGHHRIVDPHVDRTEDRLDPVRCSLDLRGLGDVDGQDERPTAGCLDLPARPFQAVTAARDQADQSAARPERARGGTADPGRCAGDHDDFPGCGIHSNSLPIRRAGSAAAHITSGAQHASCQRRGGEQGSGDPARLANSGDARWLESRCHECSKECQLFGQGKRLHWDAQDPRAAEIAGQLGTNW